MEGAHTAVTTEGALGLKHYCSIGILAVPRTLRDSRLASVLHNACTYSLQIRSCAGGIARYRSRLEQINTRVA